MNTETSARTLQDGHDMIVEWRVPDYVYLLRDDFNQEKMIQENPELIGVQITGYPFLLYIIKTLVIDEKSEGKNILEIGWGKRFGWRNIKYLRKFTDTINPDWTAEHHAWWIDERYGDEDPKNIKQFTAGQNSDIGIKVSTAEDEPKNIVKYSWENLLNAWESRWDCIFHHRIWPLAADKKVEKELKSPVELAEITDAALRPGWCYIAFRIIGSDNKPLDEQVLVKKGYSDESFMFRYKKGLVGIGEKWYHVTILRKPSQIEAIQEDTRDATKLILPR